MTRRDWAIALSLFVIAVAVRVPFRSEYAYHWDSAEFALAIRHYDVALSQPHAPGYFLYVMAGKLVSAVAGEAHASLVWLSVVCGGGLAAVLYWLGTAMFGRRAGMVAGLLGVTSPQLWFHSCVALTYVVDGFLVSCLVLVCWRAVRRGGTWADAVMMGVMLALMGGVRQQSVPAMIPLVVWTCWLFERSRWAKLVAVALISFGLGLAWFVPMVQLSGGLDVYLEIVRRHTTFNAPATWLGGGFDSLLWNVFFSAVFCVNGLVAGAIVLPVALGWRLWRLDKIRKREWDLAHGDAIRVLALWLVPMVMFGSVVGFTKQPGYVLSYLPGLLLIVAGAIASIRAAGICAVVATIVIASNIFGFLGWPARWDGMYFGLARTAREIRAHDRDIETVAQTIRERFKSDDALILHSAEYLPFGMRHFQLYLPEFRQVQLYVDATMITPAGRPMMAVNGGELEFVGQVDAKGVSNVVLIVPPGETMDVFAPFLHTDVASPVNGGRGLVYEIPLDSFLLLPPASPAG